MQNCTKKKHVYKIGTTQSQGERRAAESATIETRQKDTWRRGARVEGGEVEL